MDRHFNINSSYAPFYDTVNATEDEGNYYKRSRRLIDAIVKSHKNQGGTILLSGHAASIEVITRGMLGLSARPERLQYEAGRVNFCNFAILERDASTRQWHVHSPLSNENYYGEYEHIQNTIPLHHATSQYIGRNHSRRSSFYSGFYPYSDRLYHYY
ncbi:unnamed protein product [Rotaria sordida]|nr:unnamed protein product [Rotaria sordida]CAF1263198.1 unnamed protein product [Rotaria sordida]